MAPDAGTEAGPGLVPFSAEIVENLLDVSPLRVGQVLLHQPAGVAVLVKLAPHVLGVLPEHQKNCNLIILLKVLNVQNRASIFYSF